MNTFYSIVKVSLNNVAGDHVAIGIVLFDGEEIRYYFSAKKEKLLPVSSNKNLNVFSKLCTTFEGNNFITG